MNLEREMTSSRERGGAAGIHIILCGGKKSRMKIKINILIDRILKISVYCIIIQMTYVFFSKDTSTHRIYTCAREVAHIHD